MNPSGVDIKKNQENMVQIKDLFDIDLDILQKDKLQSTKNENLGEYNFITAADEWKKHTSYTHDTEALIYAVSASGSLGKSQYVNGKFIPSDLVVVLTAKENSEYQINLQFYNEYFNKIREDIVDSLASGTSKLTINRDLLAEHFIKYYPIEVQNKFVENKLEKYKKQIKKLKELENEIEKELENIIYE